MVLNLSGLPAAGVTVAAIPFAWGGGPGTLARVTTTGSKGEFVYDGLFPGRYLITGFVTSGPDVPPTDPATIWVAEMVDVPIVGASDVTLRLQPPLVFSGRVRFGGRRLRPPSDLASVRIDLHRDGWKPTTVDVGGDGTFASSILPGVYDLMAFVPDTGRDWVLRSAIVDGRDLLDAPIELSTATGSIADDELTFTDQHTGLSGIVTTPAGTPVSACYVVAFPADRSLWTASYRRFRHQRPATNGRFVLDELPPGDYLLAVLPDLDLASWRSPEMLGSLVERATRVTLREGERKTQDLRVTGR
jgi:hypothetical protein